MINKWHGVLLFTKWSKIRIDSQACQFSLRLTHKFVSIYSGVINPANSV